MPDDDKDIWRVIRNLQQDIYELRAQLARLLYRIRTLEADSPHARQLACEADLAAADFAASGYHDDRPNPVGADRHGDTCQCPYCPGEASTAKPGECPCGYPYTPAGDCPGSLHGCTWHNERPDEESHGPGCPCQFCDGYKDGPDDEDDCDMPEFHATRADGGQPS
jgi:hypothetical protein